MNSDGFGFQRKYVLKEMTAAFHKGIQDEEKTVSNRPIRMEDLIEKNMYRSIL